MPTTSSDSLDAQRLAYLVSIRWYLLTLGVLGCLVATSVWDFRFMLALSGVIGGLAFAVGLFSGAIHRPHGLVLAAFLVCVSVYFLPFYGRAVRGWVLASYFFFALTAFSLVLLFANPAQRESSADK